MVCVWSVNPHGGSKGAVVQPSCVCVCNKQTLFLKVDSNFLLDHPLASSYPSVGLMLPALNWKSCNRMSEEFVVVGHSVVHPSQGWPSSSWGWWEQRKADRWYSCLGPRIPESWPRNTFRTYSGMLLVYNKVVLLQSLYPLRVKFARCIDPQL